MEFSFTNEQQIFQEEVHAFFQSATLQEAIREMHGAAEYEPDPRKVYQLMGSQGLLAPVWPKEYGGRGLSNVHMGILAEAMSEYGIPDLLQLISIQVVGNLLLLSGNSEQKAAYLPAMARGEIFGSILYTEPYSGSDLGQLETKAVLLGNGHYQIDGTKIYNLKSRFANISICAVALGKEGATNKSITLFLLPLDTPGVTVQAIPTLSNEALHKVTLNQVVLTEENIVGEIGNGWRIIPKALALERTGHDYYTKGQRWLNSYKQIILKENLQDDPEVMSVYGRLAAEIEASRWLAYKVLNRIDKGKIDIIWTAYSKWYCSEIAAKVAWQANRLLGKKVNVASYFDKLQFVESLEEAYREAPGLLFSAGSSEMMLKTIASIGLNIS